MGERQKEFIGDDLSSNLEVRLLGRPVVLWGNEPLEVERRQVRELLYRLVESAEPVSRSKLCFLFWPDIPESSARRNLSRLISYLKRALPDPGMVRVAGEYVGLNNLAVWSDTKQFICFCQSNGPPSTTFKDQEAAIELYRGQFLEGVETSGSTEYENWLLDRRRAYERLYLATLEGIIKTHTTNGDLAAAIDHAQRYLAVDDLVEDIHRRLIELYGASGQREQAIRQLELCTLILERELGVQPLPETISAVRAAVSEEAALTAIEPDWSIIPSLHLPLIGRKVAWKELQGAFQDQPDGGLLLITGEAGIGKSRILQEFATSRRQLMLTGNGYANTRTLPYQPLLQALRMAAGQPKLWEGIKRIWLAELSVQLPELREQHPDLPEPVVVPPKQAKSRTLEAFTQVLLGLAKNCPLLILCLDDLHWADEETLEWLMFAGSRLPHSRLSIIGTYRSEEAEAVSRIRESLARQGVLREVVLGELTLSAVQKIFTYLPDHPIWQDDLARRLHRATGGNTLFLLETIRTLLEQEVDDIEAVEQLPLPETVQSAILSYTRRLSPLAQQILETSAVLSPNLTFDLVRLTTSRRDSEVAQGLDELTARQLLLCHGEGCQFRHDLIRTAVYQNLSPWRRRLLHRRAAESMNEVFRSQPGQTQGQIAKHFDLAAEPERAASHYEKAAIAAQKTHAHESAVVYWQRLIELATNIDRDDEAFARYYEKLGDSLAYSGKLKEARRAYADALSAIHPNKNLWRASIQRKLAVNYQIHDSFEEGAAAFQLALNILGDRSEADKEEWWQIWFQIQLDYWDLLYFNARDQEMAELASKLKGLIKEFGSDAIRYAYYFHEGQRRYRLTGYAPSEWPIEAMRLSLHYARRVGDPMMISQAQFGLGFGLLWNNEWEASLAELRGALALVERVAYRPLQTQLLAYITLVKRLSGDVDGVRAAIDKAQRSAELQGEKIYVGHALANLAWLHYREGSVTSAFEIAFDAVSHWPPPYPLHWLGHMIMLAIYLDQDNLQEAIESACIIIRPFEKRHPEELASALERAVLFWENGEPVETKKQLQEAVVHARRLNYI